jgi:uncharacterized protein (DUF433 family)
MVALNKTYRKTLTPDRSAKDSGLKIFSTLGIVASSILRYSRSTMTCEELINVDPQIMMGKPVIRGTRIAVELLLRKLSEGATEAELLNAYPHLSSEAIHAAMRYAADMIAHEETMAIQV